MDTFKRDLASGKKIEAKYLAIIQKSYPDAYIIDGYCKEWDIYIPSKSIGIEVKLDLMSQQTGNIVVEIMFNGKPSALSTTKSKYWIFDTGVSTMCVEINALKKLASRSEVKTWIAKGDTKSKDGHRIKQRYIEEISISVEEMLRSIETDCHQDVKGGLDEWCNA